MRKYAARIYTPGKDGPDQTIVDFVSPTERKAKEYARQVAREMGGRLVGFWERVGVN